MSEKKVAQKLNTRFSYFLFLHLLLYKQTFVKLSEARTFRYLQQ